MLLILASSCGCSGMPPAQLGQVAGTLIGTAVSPGIGAPVGGMIGTLAGLVVQGHVDKETEKKERVVLGEAMNPQSGSTAAASTAAASVTSPGAIPQRVWVDESVEEGRVLAGRFEHRNVR